MIESEGRRHQRRTQFNFCGRDQLNQLRHVSTVCSQVRDSRRLGKDSNKTCQNQILKSDSKLKIEFGVVMFEAWKSDVQARLIKFSLTWLRHQFKLDGTLKLV